MSLSRDGCVVPTEPLSTLLQGFVRDWGRQRPPVGGRFAARSGRRRRREVEAVPASDAPPPVSAVDYLAREAAVTAGQVERIIWSARRYPRTELRVADALLAAIERPDLLRELPVEPNPMATATARAECCSGSTPPPAFEPWSLTGA